MFKKIGAGAVAIGAFVYGGCSVMDIRVSAIIVPIAVVVSTFSAAILGVTITFLIKIRSASNEKPELKLPDEIYRLHKFLETIDCNSSSTLTNRGLILVSRKMDSALNHILTCFIEKNVLPWYSELVNNPACTVDMLRDVLWFAISQLHTRLSKVDHVKFVMCGLFTCLTRHLEAIRMAEAAGAAKGERGVFHLSSQLSSPVRERNFLRLLAEFLIMKLLPPEYYKCTALKLILKEMLACKLFEPAIDRLCDPDWINEQLLEYLRQQQAAEELNKRTYHYAASYEDFIALIHDSADVNELQHLRRNIINEIMQATAINNLKKAKGVDTSKESTPQSTGKGDLLQARNLKRYINQLTYAKAQCERRINILKTKKNMPEIPRELEGLSCHVNDNMDLTADGNGDGHNESKGSDHGLFASNPSSNYSLQNLPGRKILMFQVILESAFARRYFAIYLDEIGKGSLLSFWNSVQELRLTEKRLHYQLGMEIYYTYLAPVPPPIKVDKVFIKGVEAFLLGNRGPDVLFEIAEDLERTLEDKHYAGFLVSSTYHAMLSQARSQGIDFMSSREDSSPSGSKVLDGVTENAENVHLQFSDHSTYARNKLAHLQERLTNKLLALQAIQQTNKAEPKVVTHLENEILTIRNDHRQLEAHIERTDLWSEHFSQWRVMVQSVQVIQEKELPQLVLFVYLEKDTVKFSPSPDPSDDNFSFPDFLPNSTQPCVSQSLADLQPQSPLPSSGWVVVRKLTQLVDLHRKLCQISPSIKSTELPSSQIVLLFNKQMDKGYLQKVRVTCQNYFNIVMNDDKLSSSELLYAFLSPSPEHLKQACGRPKKSKFSFSTLFKSSDVKTEGVEDDIGNLIMLDQTSDTCTDDSVNDSVAEPLFDFLEEVCELRGVGKWLRKTLVSFVHVTYGKNITRHIRETVQSMLSESMVVYYFNAIKLSLWPSEEFQVPEATKTQEERLHIRLEAQEQFLQNLPELLCTLVGQQNARKGATRLFCTLQHHGLNKNLFYNALEAVLKELFPEIHIKVP